MFKTYTVLTHRSWGVVKQFQERPELVCQRMSEEVDFSGVLEAILKRLEIVVYLSTYLVDKSNLVRYCPQARAARKLFQYESHFSDGFLRGFQKPPTMVF